MSNNVRVRIRATVAFKFDQTVEMPRDKWEELKEVDERTMENDQMSPLGDLLNLTDPLDWSNFEDVELEVVDEGGKPVKPYDGWEPD